MKDLYILLETQAPSLYLIGKPVLQVIWYRTLPLGSARRPVPRDLLLGPSRDFVQYRV